MSAQSMQCVISSTILLAELQCADSGAICQLSPIVLYLSARLSAQLQPVVICVLSCHLCPHLSCVHSSVCDQIGCELLVWLHSVSLA